MKYTLEQQTDFLIKINEQFKSSFFAVQEVDKGYVEINDTRYKMNTVHIVIKPQELTYIEEICEGVVKEFIQDTSMRSTLYLRSPWEVSVVNPTLRCPYTFDMLDEPTEGYYSFTARFRILLNEETTNANEYGMWTKE